MPLSLPIPLDQLANAGSSMTVEELEATTPGGKPRVLVLLGGGLPGMEQAEWGGESKVVTTWYPGNGIEASQQVLGPREVPSQWAGEWNRTRLGRAPCVYRDETGTQRKIVDPGELWNILDDFRIAGVRLRVTWAVKGREFVGRGSTGKDVPVDFQVVREGRLAMLKVTPARHTDIKWSAEFHWASRGRRQDRVVSTRKDEDLSSASSAVTKEIEALEFFVDAKIRSIKSDVRLSAHNLTLGQLESMAGAPLRAVDRAMANLRHNVNQFKRIGNIAKKLAATPDAIANSVMDFARNTQAVANQFRDERGRTPIELQARRQKVSDMARAAKYFGRIEDGMQTTAQASSDLDLRLRRALVAGANQGTIGIRESSTTRAGEIISVHVCREGDTPQRVSSKFYGNPDQAEPLLRANRLPLHTPRFRPGQILVIPVLANAPRKS